MRPVYQLLCFDCGTQPLSLPEFERQNAHPLVDWRCPMCGGVASFDDEAYERSLHIRPSMWGRLVRRVRRFFLRDRVYAVPKLSRVGGAEVPPETDKERER